MSPLAFFFAAAIISVLTDKLFNNHPRIQHGITAVIALLMLISMVLAAIHLQQRPDAGPIGTAVGVLAILFFGALSGVSLVVNGYKAVTGNTDFWKF